MIPRPLAAALLALAVLVPGTGGSADARSFKADYAISLRGIPIGRASVAAELDGDRYTIRFTADAAGPARLLSDAHTEAEVRGTLGSDRPRAETYEHIWLEDGETETVSMRFAGGDVVGIDLQPPRDRPERYVPMTQEDRLNVLDPLSTFFWPAARPKGAELCDRTLPLLDGKQRFDIEARYDRMDSFSAGRGSPYIAATVCTLRYKPISGHRKDKKRISLVTEGRDMEVWLVAAGDGLAAPVRIQLASRLGRIVLEATAFEAK